MTGYEKKTAYFDLIEDGERIGNAGFVKVIINNGQMRLTINITGLHKTDTLKTELRFVKEKTEIAIDVIQIREGRCIYSRLFTEDELILLDARWEKIHGVCMHLGERRILRAKISTAVQVSANNGVGENEAQENEVYENEISGNVEAMSVSAKKQPLIHDDKWMQLEDMFPHIHPFGDEREFLSIKPKDFVILTGNYQSLANNSFLLHGFYNYHHIILGKLPYVQNNTQNAYEFYIGVPGVFYEREKAVALMFGFESFECENKTAKAGDFGYYMKRVEI